MTTRAKLYQAALAASVLVTGCSDLGPVPPPPAPVPASRKAKPHSDYKWEVLADFDEEDAYRARLVRLTNTKSGASIVIFCRGEYQSQSTVILPEGF